MLTLDEAVDRLADRVFRNYTDELMELYRANPTYTTGKPRKVLTSYIAHGIGMKITLEIKRIRQEGIYPLAIENVPAIQRVERKVFKSIVARSREQD